MVDRHYRTGAFLLVLALVLLAYSNSFHAQFHLDDVVKIEQNDFIKDVRAIPRYFYTRGGYYPLELFEFRPIKYATLALNYHFSGLDPRGYHLFNLLLHIINCLLVFTAVRMALRNGGSDDKASSSTAFVSASLFALHPLQTGTVMYLSNGRSVMLAGMFYLLGFISYMRFRGYGEAGKEAAAGKSMKVAKTGPAVRSRSGAYAWGILSLVFYMLGLLSKEIAVTLPAVVFLYDYLVHGRARGGIKAMARRVPHYAAFLATLGVFIAWKKAVHGYAVVREAPYPTAEYLMSEAKALLIYLRLAVLPVGMNQDYSLRPTTSIGPGVLLGVALLALLLGILFAYRKKEPVAVFFGLWFVVLLLPESSFVSFRDIAVEYRLYLPLAGLIAAACTVVMKLRIVTDNRKAAAGAFIAVLVVYGVLTYQRTGVYLTEIGYWRDVVAKSPWSGRAHTNLGRALLIDRQYGEAVSELKTALEVDPDYEHTDITLFNLGMYYFENGELETAAGYLESSIALNPYYWQSYSMLGDAYGRMGMHRKAVGMLALALDLRGHDENTERNLATALLMSGQEDKAKEFIEDLLEDGYETFHNRYYLALIHLNRGEKAQAMEEARDALILADDPENRSMAESLVRELGG